MEEEVEEVEEEVEEEGEEEVEEEVEEVEESCYRDQDCGVSLSWFTIQERCLNARPEFNSCNSLNISLQI